MIKLPSEFLRDPTLLDLLKQFLQIKTQGSYWKKKIDKTNEWVAWQWVNVKTNKESITLLKQTINILKEDMENYH
jgi:hypothetical protein